MKKFLSGFIVGGVLFTSVSVFAEPLHQIAVSFNIKDVIVDGQKLPLAKQALNYNGTTYVPLRPLAESLGYTTKWNPEKQNVEVMKAKITRLLSSEEIKQAFKDGGDMKRAVEEAGLNMAAQAIGLIAGPEVKLAIRN
ncbi:copper amine oxidase N-terminal domain-containing protein, partial [Mesorhizobium sp. M00.F.Ca.ET.186.01.1.1]